jgi:hypothetical protein
MHKVLKVVTAFNFLDEDLRTVRAAHGRKGKATRKECRMFVERAVRLALQAAPEPAPARKKAAAPRETFAATACTCTETVLCPACKAARERIAKTFGHDESRATGAKCGECLMNDVKVVPLGPDGRCPRCGADYGAAVRS